MIRALLYMQVDQKTAANTAMLGVLDQVAEMEAKKLGRVIDGPRQITRADHGPDMVLVWNLL